MVERVLCPLIGTLLEVLCRGALAFGHIQPLQPQKGYNAGPEKVSPIPSFPGNSRSDSGCFQTSQMWSRLMRTRGIQHGEGETHTTSEFQSRGARRLVDSLYLLSILTKARGGRQTRVRRAAGPGRKLRPLMFAESYNEASREL